MIAISCPGCRGPVDVPDGSEGKQLHCPTCGSAMLVPGASWHVVQDGAQYGPVELADLIMRLQAGELEVSTQVWCEGMSAWQPMWNVEQLKPHIAYAAQLLAAASGGAGQTNRRAAVGAGSDQLNELASAARGAEVNYHYRHVGASYNGYAVAGFVLSLTFPLLGLIFSWIALSGMKSSRNPEGHGLAQAGLIISIIFVSLSCLWLVGAIASFGMMRF